MELPASTREHRPAPGVADCVAAAVAAGTAGNRNLRRTRYFRLRGTSSLSPRATTASVNNEKVSEYVIRSFSNFLIKSDAQNGP